MMLKYFLCTLLLTPFIAGAAEFNFVKQPGPEWSYSVHMNGPIEAGDNARFRRLLAKHPERYLLAFSMSVDSPGGDVAAAIALAKEVEASALAMTVGKGEACYSACFLLYASSHYRMTFGGTVGLHRPYSKLDEYVFDSTEHTVQQQRATYALREFLAARSVPSDLIDKMMSQPSSRIYTMTASDHTRAGYLSPVAEELSIRHCGVSNENNLSVWSKGQWDKVACLQNEVLQPMRYGYLESLIGRDETIRSMESAFERKSRASGG